MSATKIDRNATFLWDNCLKGVLILYVISTITLQCCWYQRSKIKLLLLKFLSSKIYLFITFFYSFSLWIFHVFLYQWNFQNFNSSKAPQSHIFLLKTFFKCVCIQMFMTRCLFRNKWERKQRVPDTYYINNDRVVGSSFMVVGGRGPE